MAGMIKHKFQSLKSDGPDPTQVQPSHWNQDHDASGWMVDGEIPSGTINGVNKVFTLAAAPDPTSSLKLYRNGLRLIVNNSYTLVGSTITFTDDQDSIPQTGDQLVADYRTGDK
jgi:hypothetical protein